MARKKKKRKKSSIQFSVYPNFVLKKMHLLEGTHKKDKLAFASLTSPHSSKHINLTATV